MQIPGPGTWNYQLLMIAFCVVVGTLAAAWPLLRFKRKQSKCSLTPLEVRAFDVVDALQELKNAIDKNGGQLTPEVNAQWVTADTAAHYLRRYLEHGR